MIITNCPRCGAMNATTTCTKCGWSQFTKSTVSTRITGEIEIMLSGKALLDDYKRLLFENRNLTARIAELEAALTNARELVGMTPPPAFPEWIPVTAKLPEDGETVFVIIHDGFERFENGNEVARLTYLGNGNWWSWESERYVVTHWMPLPNPPEAK